MLIFGQDSLPARSSVWSRPPTRGDFKHLFILESVGESLAFEPEVSFRTQLEGLNLRREASDSAGDPTRFSPRRPAMHRNPC
jgi:hypothetical protein